MGKRHRIVDLVGIAPVCDRPTDFRDRQLERIDFFGARTGILGAGDCQHLLEIFLVGVARRDDFLVALQVVVPIRHAEARLPKIDGVDVGILVVDSEGEGEGAIEAKRRIADRMGDVAQRFQAGDFGQILLGRLETVRFDLLGVHVGRVEIAQLAPLGGQLAVWRCGEIGDETLQACFVLLVEFQVHAGIGAVGRDHVVLHPIAVGIKKEVVPRLHRFVDVGKLDTPGLDSGVSWRRGEHLCWGRDEDCSGNKCDIRTKHSVLHRIWKAPATCKCMGMPAQRAGRSRSADGVG